MDEEYQKDWKRHIKLVITKNMKNCIDILEFEDIDEVMFVNSITSLENGIMFLKAHKKDKENV